MKRNLSIALALGFALCAATACSKEKKRAEQEPELEAAAEATEVIEVAARTEPMPVVDDSAAALLAHLPADTEIVVSFSMRSLSESPLWKKIGPAAIASASKELGQVQESCGFNPLDKLHGVVIGMNTANEKEPVLIVDGFARNELSQCISAMALKEGNKISLAQEDAFTVVTSENKDESMTLAWTGPSTFIMVPGAANKEFLQARLDGTASVAGNKAFMAAASKPDHAAPIWFAAAFKSDSPMAQSMSQLGDTPTGLYGSLGLASGLDVDLGVTFASAEAASSTLSKVRPFLTLARARLGANAYLLDKLELATAGADMLMSMNLSELDLQKLQAMAGPMLSGFGK